MAESGSSDQPGGRPDPIAAGNIERLIAIVNSVDGIVWEADAETFRCTFVSPQVERLLGYPINRWINESTFWADHIHPEDKDGVIRFCMDCMQRSCEHEIEYRMLAMNGRVVWIRGTITLSVDGLGPAKLRGIMFDITARKKAELAVRESEARLNFALDASQAGAWDLNLVDLTVVRTLGHAVIFGYRTLLPQWTYEMFLEHVLPEDRAEVDRRFKSAIAAKSDWSFECRIRRVDGAIRWIWAKGRHGANRISGIVHDITERKQAAELLAQKELLLSESQRVAKIGSWRWELTGELDWSDETYRIYGVSPESFTPSVESLTALVHPDDRPALQQWIADCATGKKTGFLEFRILLADGGIRFLSGCVEMRYDAEGKPSHMLGTVQDITELKKEELARRLSEKKFRATIDAAPVPMALNDEQQKITYLNPAFVQTFGYSLQVIPTLSDWWPRAYPDPTYRQWVADAWVTELARSKESGTNFAPIELKVRCKDGTDKYVLASAAPFSTAYQGDHLVVLYDITERKRLEQEREVITSNLRESEAFNISVLDSLSEHIAVLDPKGVIIAVNKAWKQFAERNDASKASQNFLGINYLDVCAKAKDSPWGQEAKSVASGIRAVLDGKVPDYNIEYPCHSVNEQRWFHMNVTRLRGSKTGAVIRHASITEIKHFQNALRKEKEFSHGVLDGLSYLICVVDAKGTIIAVNKAWRVHALKGGAVLGRVSEGRNYLAVCDSTTGRDSVPAARFANGIREVLAGKRDNYVQEYSCHSSSGERRLIGKVTRFPGEGSPFCIIAHEDVTDWRKSEDALHVMEKRLALALDSTNDGMWDWDVENNRIERSERWYTMLGYKPNEIESEYAGWKSIVHPEDISRAEEAIRANHEGRTDGYEVELRMKRKDGGWCWILSRGRVVQRDKKGTPIRMVGTHTDITIRKQIEEALRESERFLSESLSLNRAIMDHFPGLISAKDLNGNIMFANRQFEVLDGPAPSEYIGKNVYELFPKEIADKLWQNDLDVQKSKRAIQSEEAVPHRDGVLHTYQTTKLPLFKNEQMFGTCAISTDITDRKRAELAQGESEERLRSVLITAAEGIVLIDSHGVIHLFNNAAEVIFGYPSSEIVGQQIERLMPSPHKENHAGYIQQFLDTGKAGIIGKGRELTATRKDGSPIPIYLNVSQTTLSGRIFFTGIIRDLTEQKRAEEERKNLERQYAEAQKMEALGVLAGGIAHDFNNILASILGYAEVAKSKTTDARVAGALDHVLNASIRARDLIKQVLIFSRTNNAQLKPTDVQTILNEVLDLVRSAFPTSVKVDLSIAPAHFWVMGDATQLHQLLLNLLTNAYQAMPNGGTLSVGLAEEVIEIVEPGSEIEPGPFIRLTIKDSGTGMTEEVRKRIFEPFFSTKGTKGTGLGLSVVHGVMKKHSGMIRVESREGEGSTFTVWLPASRQHRISSVQAVSKEFKGSGTVLIIDDDDLLLSMASEMIQDLGFEVAAFANPEEAIRELRRAPSRYSLMITDYTMPTLNGLEVINLTREIAPNLPRILMTGFGDTLIFDKSRKDFFLLTKPFKLSELKSALSEILTRE